ncbi:response regulator [Haloarculaceae archaeon H-GB11]|nr:response regulator [Haloarculaceae archaeon H-GB11]
MTGNATVLVVDDEVHLADLYADYLDGEHEVRTAYGGDEALDALDEDVDVVLLDRRMPVTSGNEVLAAIEERGLECQVAMVTAVDPDFDVLDMGCDDYLVKPVERDDLLRTIDRLLKISTYTDRYRELTAKKLKRNILEVEKSRVELRENEQFQTLRSDIERLKADIEDIADDLGSETIKRNL